MDRPIVGGGLKLAWVKEQDLPCLLVQRVTRIRGLQGVALTNYLRYALSAPDFLAHIDRITTGANIPHISAKDIARFEFLLPPLTEQNRAVELIAKYDDLIDTNLRRIALLEESARLLYREWFVNLRFPGHESVTWKDGLPEEWQQRCLKDIATLNYGKALKDADRIAGDIPVYGSSGIVGSHNKALTDGPALIVGRKGNVGSVFFSHGPCFAIDTVYFISGSEVSYYLFLLLQTMNFISSDSAVPGLNRNYAYGLMVLYPNAAVLSSFEASVKPIFEQINVLKIQNKFAQEARDELLPKLMSGAIRV